jgi:hypothetical protein
VPLSVPPGGPSGSGPSVPPYTVPPYTAPAPSPELYGPPDFTSIGGDNHSGTVPPPDLPSGSS